MENSRSTRTERNVNSLTTTKSRIAKFLQDSRGLLFFSLLAIQATAFGRPPLSEVLALQELALNTGFDNWTDRRGWSFDPLADPCATSDNDWYGIYCSPDRAHIQNIFLSGNNLSGSIPADTLQRLPNLEQIAINGNQLGGNLPALSGLSALIIFDAHHNGFSGRIPSLEGLPQLVYFSVEENQLSGSLPCLSPFHCPDGAAPPQLVTFNANNNNLSGQIGSLDGSQLQLFYVRDNYFSGNLPSFRSATDLVLIDVSMNELSGPVLDVPPSLQAGHSFLCPNNLSPEFQPGAVQQAWDVATGHTPWYSDCGTDEIFIDSFD